MDSLTWIHDGGRVAVFSMKGQIRVSASNMTFAGAPRLQWQTSTSGNIAPDGKGSWYFQRGHQNTFVVFPHRLPIAIFAVPALFAAFPWVREFKWQFSLRTLLIATTLVAVVLGIMRSA